MKKDFKKTIYGFPILPKAGLANMLIPWADCLVWCKDNGIRQISPFWGKIRIGPYLRKERDKRQYQRLFNPHGTITGLRRLFLLTISRRVFYEDIVASEKIIESSRNTIVCFNSMNHLERLVGRNEEIDMELRRITKSKFLPANLPSIFIGVHVRFGDFPDRVEGSDQINFRQPIEWYVEGIQQLRIVLKGNIPAIVFSDGMDQELEPLLKLENVVRSPQSEAISDLFAIARSLVLFTSRSSFSLFGAFLGQVPSIWYEGKKDIYRKGYLKNDDTELSIEWMPGQLFPDAFLTELKTRIDCKK